jgi:uncharacterized membrane protein
VKHFSRHLGKVIVGCIAVLSVLLWVLLLIGFFVGDIPKEYVENMWLFFVMVSIVTVSFSIPAWRWRKKILIDVLAQL